MPAMCQTVGLCGGDRLRDTDHFFSGLFHTSRRDTERQTRNIAGYVVLRQESTGGYGGHETGTVPALGWGQLAMEHFQVEP